jgi:pimeloyl-ACP methyl ester carboxylesterase
MNCESGKQSLARNHTHLKGQIKMNAVEYDDSLMDFSLAFLKDGPNDDLGPAGFFWLGGFMSDMTGSKAESLADLARTTRRNCLRFDYSGHGQSAGLFTDGTISHWLEQATHMFLKHTRNKRIIIGSSMGGWLALLLAKRLKKDDAAAFRRIGGMVLIAPAADMTIDLMWQRFPESARKTLIDDGVYMEPSDYGAPYPITLKLIEDGLNHAMLDEGLSLPFPVRILQGSLDPDVPPHHALKTMEALQGDIALTLIKGGDHRLSTPPQLRIIRETVLQLALRADGEAV